MSKYVVVFLLIFMVLSSSAWAKTIVDEIKARGELVVGSDAAYPPFEFVDKDGNIVGIDIDIAKAVADYLGVRLRVVNTSFDGIIPALLAKKFDFLISAMTITPERAKQVDFSIPYYNAGQLITVRADDNRIKGEKDLQGKIVAVQLGTTGHFYAESIPGVKEVRKFETVDGAFLELKSGRADAVIADDLTSLAFVRSTDGLKVINKLLTKEQYGIAVRKEDKALLRAVNTVIARLKKEGVIEELRKKWASW
ncbi:TPA: basic amino acid ABC transporter substrate-binding protein [bacterium]|nr:basic amino acid ABC transporter substrate-binding protein [bacterium]